MTLAEKNCVPCRGGVSALAGDELKKLQQQLPGWSVVKGHHLEKTFSFPDFKSALDFVVRAGDVAERQGHHPDILLRWGSAQFTIFTHKVDGLTESDFVLAAKIDRLPVAA